MQTDTPERDIADACAELADFYRHRSSINQDLFTATSTEITSRECKELSTAFGCAQSEITRLRKELQAAREALRDLVADCDDYVRINNLYDGNGEPAKWATVERARAALGEGQ